MKLPVPPYYAVIFSSLRTGADEEGYAQAADAMVALAETMPGFLGIESARGADGFGITVSYWARENAIRAWREDPRHREIQALGKTRWYASFTTRVALVERTGAVKPAAS
jgi:heme-degrading monooxygenase HmoA